MASGLKPIEQKSKAPLNSVWTEFMKTLSEKRAHVGLSRLARFASARGINPENIDDSAIEGFIAGVREGSLHRKLNDLHRNVTLIWNRAASQPQLRLKQVTVPSFRGLPRRIDWTLLPEAFRTDVEGYLYWCAGSDPFAADARRSPRGGRSPPKQRAARKAAPVL